MIRCEGPTHDTNIKMCFTRKNKCREYIEKYCYTQDCKDCQIHWIAENKYEMEG